MKYFNVLKNGTVDIMHDILEGAVPFALKIFFLYLVENKLVSEKKINSMLYSYNYGVLHRKDRPSVINLKKKSKTSIGLYASQNWCVITHVLFIFDKFKEKSNDERPWKLVLSLIKAMQIIFSEDISTASLNILDDIIEGHLKLILDLGHSLLPNHHFMTHYSNIIRSQGPLVQMWSMRYESYHRNFTKIGRYLNNFSNIAKTLAERHQQKQSIVLKNSRFNTDLKEGKKNFTILQTMKNQ